MPKIGAQFVFKSPQANFARDQYKTLADMKVTKKSEVDQGHISYCLETGIHYIFNPNNEYKADTGYWSEMTASTIETGATAPSDTKKIWVDTSDSVETPYDEVSQLKSDINRLEIIVNQLAKLLTIGIKAGDSTIGGRTMLSKFSTPLIPTSFLTEDNYYNEEAEYPQYSLCVHVNDEGKNTIYYAVEDIPSPAGVWDESKWTTEEPSALEPSYDDNLIATVPNIAVKIDTSLNFKKNYTNLIDGELVFCKDLSALYIYSGGKFLAIGSSGNSSGAEDSKHSTVITIDGDYLMSITDEGQENVWVDNNDRLCISNICEIKELSVGNYILEITS